ncbi:MAG: hypothetical protein OHK93_006849 [Ramalina farinacea]|uniref:Uncharacterized protein n=1 Tax=Ramalina farinacea TaxID=258253 RepID=A0AA43QLL4_9LECA|nr:hypothetical protein [Ramalina farinacea]
MTAGYPQMDRFRWELYRCAIRPFHFEDSKTRNEMDWIWQFCDDSIVMALLFYLAPRLRDLEWQAHEFSQKLLMRFLSSKVEGRPGHSTHFLSRLTSVRLSPAHNDNYLLSRGDSRQPHKLLTIAVVCMFLPLPSMRKVSCARVSAIHMYGEGKPKFPLPGSSTVRELKLDESTIIVKKGDWLYKTIAAMKSLETLQFTPDESDYSDFAAVLTVLAETQSKSLKKLKLWVYTEYSGLSEDVDVSDTKPVNVLLGFANLRYLDIDIDFLSDLRQASKIDGQPLAMTLPSGIEHLKLRLLHIGQLDLGMQGLEDTIRQKPSTLLRLNTLHLECHWNACDGSAYDDMWAILSLIRTLYDRCKADNVTLLVTAADGEIDCEDLYHPNSEVESEDGTQDHGMEASTPQQGCS